MSNTFPIEELRSLLEKARATDADLKQFGAEHHKYQWNPPASLKEIEAFERETGITTGGGAVFPLNLREILILLICWWQGRTGAVSFI